jgi:hypothetical protein
VAHSFLIDHRFIYLVKIQHQSSGFTTVVLSVFIPEFGHLVEQELCAFFNYDRTGRYSYNVIAVGRKRFVLHVGGILCSLMS